MRVTIVEHFRLPYQCAGSEVFLHRLGKALQDASHEVTLVTTDTPMAPSFEVYDGMPCFSVQAVPQEITRAVNTSRPDLILTHHQRAQIAVPLARGMSVPSVFVMHNDFVHNQRVLMYSPSLTIFNTEWIAEKWKHRVLNGMVIHPPVLPGQCDLPPGEQVTLINLNRDKGSEVFYLVAEKLPHINFLGVIGAHGRFPYSGQGSVFGVRAGSLVRRSRSGYSMMCVSRHQWRRLHRARGTRARRNRSRMRGRW